MSIKDRVRKLGQKTGTAQDTVVENFVRLMKYFHWTLDDVKKLPIPSYIELTKIVIKIEKEERPAGGKK